MPSGKRQKTPNPASQRVQMAAKLGSVLASAEGWRASGRILGLDLEPVNTGVVILSDRGHVLRHTTFHYPLKSTKKSKITERDRVDRMLHLANDIVGIIRKFSISHVAVEGGGASFVAKSQAIQRGGVFYVVSTQIWLACHLFPEVVAANSARKEILGYGKASKEDVQAVLEAHRIRLDSDHEADAYIVARWLFEDLKRKKEKVK